jgi:hypothetical protein
MMPDGAEPCAAFQELSAERDELYAALTIAVTVIGFDLKRMIEFGPDYNQAVQDAFDAGKAALAMAGDTP